MAEVQIPPVELVDVANLKTDGQNPNRMSEKQHRALRESILRYGFIVPIISARGEKTATFLQLMKETGMRAGEAWNLNWTDIDFVNTTVRITPEKRSNPRMFKVSSKLLAMLAIMPKKQIEYSEATISEDSRDHTKDREREQPRS